MQRLGWFLAIQPARHDSLDTPQIVIRRRTEVPSVDPKVFHTSITTSLARALLPREIPSINELVVRVKFWDTWSPDYTWPLQTTVADLVRPWSIASRRTGERSEMWALFGGKQMSNEYTTQSYRRDPNDTSVMRIHFVLQLHGGGSKLDAHLKVRQSVVELLLQMGADSLRVNDFAREVLEKGGLTRVQHLLQIRDFEERLTQLLRLAFALHIAPIAIENPDQERARKMRSRKPKALPHFAAVKAEDFTLASDCFGMPDGSITSEVKEGVLLIDAAACDDFVKSFPHKPACLALVILGQECPWASSSCKKVHVPAVDNKDVQVVLKACLHQVGSQTVSPMSKPDADVPVAESHLVCHYSMAE